MTPRLLALLLALAGAGCGPRPGAPVPPTGPARDSVIVAGTAELPDDLVRDGALTFEGQGAFETVTIGELALLQAETDAQRAAAQRAIDGGMALNDPARIVRLLDTGAERHEWVLGQTTAPAPIRPDQPFTSEAVFRITPSEGSGVCASLGVCDRIILGMQFISDAGPIRPNERRMPSSLAVTVEGPFGHVDEASLSLGHNTDLSSVVSRAELSEVSLGRPIHRLRLDYAPGQVRVTLDGIEIMSEPVSLGGPPGRLSLTGRSGPDGPGLVVTSWRVTQP